MSRRSHIQKPGDPGNPKPRARDVNPEAAAESHARYKKRRAARPRVSTLVTRDPHVMRKGNLAPHLVPGNPGNSGGKPGRSGRRAKWLENWAFRMLTAGYTKNSVRRILKSKGQHPAFVSMWKSLAERAAGKAAQPVEVAGKLTLEQLLSASNAIDAPTKEKAK